MNNGIINGCAFDFSEFLNGEEKILATEEWMRKKFDEYNEKYFDNKLPKTTELHAGLIGKEDNLNTFGFFTITKKIYMSSKKMSWSGEYIIYTGVKFDPWGKRLIDESTRVTDVASLNPRICLTTNYKFTENEMEDTLIHEMVHLWTYKDGLAPKQAHGKEFKRKCDEIRWKAKRQYGKSYNLHTYGENPENVELSDAGKALMQRKIKSLKRNGGVVDVYVKVKKFTRKHQENRLLFCATRDLENILREIRVQEGSNIAEVATSTGVYEKMCVAYGKMKTMRTYRWYNVSDYPKFLEFMAEADDRKTVIGGSTNESLAIMEKREYVKPSIEVVEIGGDVNLSNANMEDIVNADADDIHEN